MEYITVRLKYLQLLNETNEQKVEEQTASFVASFYFISTVLPPLSLTCPGIEYIIWEEFPASSDIKSAIVAATQWVMDGFFKGLCDIRSSEGQTDRQRAASREETIVLQVRPGPALRVALMVEISPSSSKSTLRVWVCVYELVYSSYSSHLNVLSQWTKLEQLFWYT